MFGMADASQDDVAAAISGFYDAAMGEIDWPIALSRLPGLVPGVFSTFEILDKTAGKYVDFHSSAMLDVNESYLDHYFSVNPRLPKLLSRPDLTVMGDYDFLSESEMDRDEFYNDFLQPHGLRYFAGVTILDTPEHIATFSVQRSARHGHIDGDVLSLLRRLQPHMSAAARIHLKVGDLLRAAESREAALHWLADGVVILGADGQVRYANPAAAAIFRDNDGLSIVHGEVDMAASKTAFGRAVKATLGSLSEDGGARQVVLPRPSGRPPYILTFAPASGRTADDGLPRDGAVTVFIRDPASSAMPPAETLRRSFALSASETGVALSLVDGMTAKEIAEARGVSLATVRTQVQSILRKTGQRRQADLIRLLARFPGPTG